jgi:hypothetical protein
MFIKAEPTSVTNATYILLPLVQPRQPLPIFQSSVFLQPPYLFFYYANLDAQLSGPKT